MTDEELQHLAAEASDITAKRKQLQEKKASLESGLRDLQR